MQAKLKSWLLVAGIILVFVADVLLVHAFNTLLWPYLWPRPGIFIAIALFVAAIWFPRFFSGIWALRFVGLSMIFIGECYILHSFQIMIEAFSPVALIHMVGATGIFVVMVVSYINQIIPRNNKQAPSLPDELPYVAAVIPTYGEPLDILRKTVLSLKCLDYPSDHLYILISDDGHRESVLQMANELDVSYNKGAQKDAKAGNLNSALEYLCGHFPQAGLILTQDADETVDPSFLKKTVGYFSDPKLAFVQTPKEAIAPPGDPFGVRDRIFYDVVQPGRNGSNAAFSCGSGVIWRIPALKSIGGFVTWNIVEDLTTSYSLHCAGYHSEYHNEILTIGLAPDDIPGLLKQRGTWATDTWRLFLFRNPLRQRGLSIRQRLQYTELGLFYVTSAFFMPLIMITPLVSLLTGEFIKIEGSALFPWLAITFFYYAVLAQGNAANLKSMWEYWIGHSVTYHRAFWIAIRSHHNKPSYKVTRKTRQAGFYGSMIWAQFLYLFLGGVACIHGLFGMPNTAFDVRLANAAILLFFMFMISGICKASFYGLDTTHELLLQAQNLNQRWGVLTGAQEQKLRSNKGNLV